MLAFLDVSLPIWIFGVIVGEMYVLLRRRKHPWEVVAFTILVLAVCIAGWYYFEPPTPEQTAQPGRFASIVLAITAVPLAVLVTGVELLSKRTPTLVTHLLLALWAAVIAWAWPLAVIYSFCMVGFECL
jgi:hypothetical protein